MAFCKNCGTKLDEGAKFCAGCGAAADAVQAPAAAPPVTPAPEERPPAAPGAASTSPWGYFTGVLQKYAVFKGRARRAEYWWYALIYVVIYIACLIIDNVAGLMFTENYGVMSTVFMLALFLPSWGCMVRRFHDRNMRTWWCLVPVYNLIQMCKAGMAGSNRFGPDPKTVLDAPPKKTAARAVL